MEYLGFLCLGSLCGGNADSIMNQYHQYVKPYLSRVQGSSFLSILGVVYFFPTKYLVPQGEVGKKNCSNPGEKRREDPKIYGPGCDPHAENPVRRRKMARMPCTKRHTMHSCGFLLSRGAADVSAGNMDHSP